MKWHVALTIIVVGMAGCHAPTPSFDVLAPYGPQRVPPPGTGSHGTSGTYYNRTSPPATSVPGVSSGSTDPATSGKMETNASNGNQFLGSDDSWKPIRTNATPDPAPVFGDATDRTASRILPVSYRGAGKGGTALQLSGMPVNDATGRASSEPARFRTPGDAIPISQLTRATGSTGQNATRTVVSSAKSSDRIQPVSSEGSTSETTLKWRSRSADD